MKVILSNQQSSLSSIHLFLNPFHTLNPCDFFPVFLISTLNIINPSIP